ncbi:MAG: hypothetical protein LUH21_04600 [Clostridiales bacterium]|nr:hypothetical protein [Clostridiales bacterium]
MNSFYDEEFTDYEGCKFYHGTSSALDIGNKILPPCDTGVLRENFRKEQMNRVFCTRSLLAAYKYARKAAMKYGGSPVIYLVSPDEGSLYYNKGAEEYSSNFCMVIKEV